MQVKVTCYRHGVICPALGVEKKPPMSGCFPCFDSAKSSGGLMAHWGYKNAGPCGRTFRDFGIECRVSADSESRQ